MLVRHNIHARENNRETGKLLIRSPLRKRAQPTSETDSQPSPRSPLRANRQIDSQPSPRSPLRANRQIDSQPSPRSPLRANNGWGSKDCCDDTACKSTHVKGRAGECYCDFVEVAQCLSSRSDRSSAPTATCHSDLASSLPSPQK